MCPGDILRNLVFSSLSCRGRANLHLCLLAMSLWLLLCIPPAVFAHPMGNFSINHFSALEVYPGLIQLSYVVDMAEVPTFQEMQEYGLTPQLDHPSATVYRERKIQELQKGLVLQVGEQTLSLALRSSALTFPPGAGNLPTLRISAVYDAPLAVMSGRLLYEDRNYPQRAGWKEIIATAHEGITLSASSVPAISRSNQLTAYTDDLIQAPPQEVRASLSFQVSVLTRAFAPMSPVLAGAETSSAKEAQTPRSVLTELMTARQLSVEVILVSLLAAVGLGAFHALEPGHGKTLVAAYLVGSRGTAWHALLLGLTVTASHTIGVYALGGVALFASHYVMPEQLYPWLGLASGLLITGMGVVLLAQAWRHRQHVHPSDHHHHHDAHHPEHSPHHHDHLHDAQASEHVSYGALFTLGITGGMIPCPAALVMLLSAVALQRITFGLLLIVAFSVGLAAVLVSAGLLLVSARGVVQRWSGKGPWLTYLPFVSPLVITPIGIVIALRSLAGTGLVPGLG